MTYQLPLPKYLPTKPTRFPSRYLTTTTRLCLRYRRRREQATPQKCVSGHTPRVLQSAPFFPHFLHIVLLSLPSMLPSHCTSMTAFIILEHAPPVVRLLETQCWSIWMDRWEVNERYDRPFRYFPNRPCYPRFFLNLPSFLRFIAACPHAQQHLFRVWPQKRKLERLLPPGGWREHGGCCL